MTVAPEHTQNALRRNTLYPQQRNYSFIHHLIFQHLAHKKSFFFFFFFFLFNAQVSKGDVQSDAFAASSGVDHKKVIGLIKSLEAAGVEMVTSAAKDHSKLALTPEAETYVTAGSPEAQAFAAVPPEGCTLAEFKSKVDKAISEVGFKQAMQSKWLGMVKGAEPRVERKVDTIEDVAKGYLAAVAEGRASEIPQKELDTLVKKRKLVKQENWKTYAISKGAKFALERKNCLLYTSPSPRDATLSRMPSSA